MKHLSTWDLLDLAEDLINLRDMSWTHARRNSAMIKLASIDAELLSRVPEGEFVTMLTGPLPIRSRHNGGEWVITGYWYQPVGFEPYIPNEDEAWLFDALYGHIDGIPTVDEGRNMNHDEGVQDSYYEPSIHRLRRLKIWYIRLRRMLIHKIKG